MASAVICFLKQGALTDSQTMPTEKVVLRVETDSQSNRPLAEEASATEDSAGEKHPEQLEPTTEVAPPGESIRQLSGANIVAALTKAAAGEDPAAAVAAVLEEMHNCDDCIEPLKELVVNQNTNGQLRVYAAEALVRSGSKDAVEFVLDQVLKASSAGDSNFVGTLKKSLQSPTSLAGAEAMFDLLLGSGRYAAWRDALPEDLRATLRNAIRIAPDQEEIGNFAAGLYLASQANGHNAALWELYDGLAHPNMLSTLAVKAFQDGSPQNAVQFLDRLGQNGDQGTVQAFVQASSQEPALLKDTAERLYAWSLQHKEQAQPGLFLEYITDSTLSPAQRIAAAYGLAGVADAQLAIRALEKAANLGGDSTVNASLTALQGFLARSQHNN